MSLIHFRFNGCEDIADDLRAKADAGLGAYLLDGLKAVVQCDHGRPGNWSTIAAFDLAVVADAFCQQYREQTPSDIAVLYRVVRIER